MSVGSTDTGTGRDTPAVSLTMPRSGRYRGASLPRWWPALLVLVLAVFVATRIAGVQVSLWWDEAFTAHHYVRNGPGTWFDPERYVANNHLLFSMLTWASSRLLGTAEPALRLWAVVPGSLAVLGLAGWCLRRYGGVVATTVLVLSTTSALVLAMTIQARGYGLVLLAATLLLVLPVTAVGTAVSPATARVPWTVDLAVAVAGAVAMTTFPPTVAVYLAHTGAWLLHRGQRVRLVLLTALTGALTLAVYRPLLELLLERSDRVGSRFADPITWWSPVVAPLQLVGGPAFGGGRGAVAVWSLPAVAALLFGVAGLVVWWRRDRWLAVHLLAGLGGSIVLLAPAGFHLADRYISFLLPHATLALAGGVVGLATVVVGQRRTPGVVGVLLALLLLASTPGLWWSATTPLQAFRPASELALRANEIDPDTRLIVDSYHTGYRWYLDHVEVERITDQQELDDLLCQPEVPVVFLRHPDRPVLEVPDCLRADPAAEHRFAHQRDPGHLSVWVAGGAGVG